MPEAKTAAVVLSLAAPLPSSLPAAPAGPDDLLALVASAGEALAQSRSRAATAEARAEEIAMVAVAQVKAISARLAETEKRLKEVEETSAATIRGLRQQVATSDEWAATSARQAKEAEARAERAEARALQAEEWLARLGEALRATLAPVTAGAERTTSAAA